MLLLKAPFAKRNSNPRQRLTQDQLLVLVIARQANLSVPNSKETRLMNRSLLLLSILIAGPAFAGDLWELTSSSTGPEGKSVPFSEKQCLPKDAIDPSQMLGILGICTFDSKSGTSSAMSFSLTCKLPGMPSDLGAMKVTGDARLNANSINMRYTITPSNPQNSAGGDFRMSGNMEGRKVGQCNER